MKKMQRETGKASKFSSKVTIKCNSEIITATFFEPVLPQAVFLCLIVVIH